MSESSSTSSLKRRSSFFYGSDDDEECSYSILNADKAGDNGKTRRSSSRPDLRLYLASSDDDDDFSINGKRGIQHPNESNSLFWKACLCLFALHYVYLVVASFDRDAMSASIPTKIGIEGPPSPSFDSSQRTTSDIDDSQSGENGRTTEEVAKETKKYQKKIDNIPVFYNLYLDPKADQNETIRVQNLVNDQLSYLIPDIHYPVYVHSIGKELPIPNTELLQHHTEAAETVTLHSMWQYCREHKEKKVVYLHSKGSYHHNPQNEALRMFLTRSVLSRQCAYKDEHKASSDEGSSSSAFACDVCTNRFSPFPHPHTSGNMFLADCEYVSQLIDPLEFEGRMHDIPRIKEWKEVPIQARVHRSCVGIGRFACEHWIHSAPFVRPCDLFKSSSFIFGYDGIPNATVVDTIDLEGEDSAFELQAAPRFQYRTYTTDRTVDYWTGLEYRLQEYQTLYNATPAWPSLSSSSSSSSSAWWGWKMDSWVDEAFTSPGTKAK